MNPLFEWTNIRCSHSMEVLEPKFIRSVLRQNHLTYVCRMPFGVPSMIDDFESSRSRLDDLLEAWKRSYLSYLNTKFSLLSVTIWHQTARRFGMSRLYLVIEKGDARTHRTTVTGIVARCITPTAANLHWKQRTTSRKAQRECRTSGHVKVIWYAR